MSGGDHATLEIPRGVSEAELERALVGKLTELQKHEGPHSNGEKGSTIQNFETIAQLRWLSERFPGADCGELIVHTPSFKYAHIETNFDISIFVEPMP